MHQSQNQNKKFEGPIMDVRQALIAFFVLTISAISLAEEKRLFTKQGPLFRISDEKPHKQQLRKILAEIGGLSEVETMLAERAIIGRRQEQIDFWKKKFVSHTEPVKINTLYSREVMVISNEELWPTIVYTYQQDDDRLEIMNPRREEIRISQP